MSQLFEVWRGSVYVETERYVQIYLYSLVKACDENELFVKNQIETNILWKTEMSSKWIIERHY